MAMLALKAFSSGHFHSPSTASMQSQAGSSSQSGSKFYIADILGMKSPHPEPTVSSSKLMPSNKKRLTDQLMSRHVLAARGILLPPLAPPPPPPPQFGHDESSLLAKLASKSGGVANGGGNSPDYDDDDEILNECGDGDVDADDDDDLDSDQGLT